MLATGRRVAKPSHGEKPAFAHTRDAGHTTPAPITTIRTRSSGNPSDPNILCLRLLMVSQSFFHGFWTLVSDLEESSRGPVRLTPSLFPVTKRGYAHANHQRELFLRFLQSFSNCLDVFRTEGEFAARRRFAAENSASLTDTLKQFIEITLFH